MSAQGRARVCACVRVFVLLCCARVPACLPRRPHTPCRSHSHTPLHSPPPPRPTLASPPSYGAHCDDYPHDYLTIAAALGTTRRDIDECLSRLGVALAEFRRRQLGGAAARGGGAGG